MRNYGPVIPLFERYIEAWNTSATAKRVEDVDSMAIERGSIGNWEGPTIPEIILDILKEYTDILRENPALLIDPDIEHNKFREQLQGFLDDEQILIDEADALTEEMGGYKLGKLDPRWHKANKKRIIVVGKFRLTDEDYQIHLPKLQNEEKGD